MSQINEELLNAVREKIHALNNALNALSMQAELVRLLSNDSKSHEKISACIDTITKECKKSSTMAIEVGNIVKLATEADNSC